ncbi:MAG TPA: hypothetical protein VM243_19620 [Phycisphaerae bacterium]|nr:hypothetical protein [Phycisphaerae bacterium]
MAENETLDLWDRYSRRWQRLLESVESSEPAESIADEGVRCLYRTFKNLVELLPLEELLQAADRGDRAAVDDLVRRCSKARDYAELIGLEAAVTNVSARLLEGVARGAVDRFLDQIAMKVVGDGHWPDLARFRMLREQVQNLMRPGIARLAGQVAAHPNEKPRMPAKTAERHEREQRDLLGMSLAARSGTDG